MTKDTGKITQVEAALARGAEGKASTNCRKSLADQKAARKPRPEPEVAVAKVVKAAKASKAKATKPARRAAGSFLSLKQNAPVRKLLKEAAEAAGGNRLSPIGFDSYTAFLAGVPLDAQGNADVAFVPVKGNEPIRGKNVKLTIRGGKVIKVK